MYYEERIMDNRLWYRSTPTGQWSPVEDRVILGRMLLAEQQLQELRERAATDFSVSLHQALASKRPSLSA